MTAAELIKQLKKLPPKTQVILASDEEGNEFHGIDELAEFDKGVVAIWPRRNTLLTDDYV